MPEPFVRIELMGGPLDGLQTNVRAYATRVRVEQPVFDLTDPAHPVPLGDRVYVYVLVGRVWVYNE